MAKSENQKLKIMYLLKILLEKTDDDHGISIDQMIEELKKYDISAERKSLYTDIADIDKLGYEVDKYKDGRVTLYKITSREFQLVELKLLIDAIQSSKFISESKSRSLINKIKKLCSIYEARTLDRQVYVHGRIKSMNELIYYSVDDIHNAINQNKKVSFNYYVWNISKKLEDRHGGKPVVVSPWALTWDDENYYLVAFDETTGIIKHYRVDKIKNMNILDEDRAGKESFKNFDMAKYAVQNFGMYNGELRKVSILFPNNKCGIFIDRFGKDISFIPEDKDHSRLNIDVAISPQFFGWIFSLGSDIRIVEPEDVREQLLDYAKKFLENYDN